MKRIIGPGIERTKYFVHPVNILFSILFEGRIHNNNFDEINEKPAVRIFRSLQLNLNTQDYNDMNMRGESQIRPASM